MAFSRFPDDSLPTTPPSVGAPSASSPSASASPASAATSAHIKVKKRRTHSQPTLWAIATIFFFLGAGASTLTIWQLHKLYRATVAPVIDVEGTVQAKYGYQEDADELRPSPSGYFIDSPGVGRVYLTGKPLNNYVGQRITANGSVSGICGPKSIPCYPLVEVRSIEVAQ